MLKKQWIVLVLAATLLLAFSALCWAGKAGKFATALKNTYCSGTSGPTWYGCYAYMHYRVDLVKDKNSAKSICYKNGCGSKYGTGSEFETCKTGCDKAFGYDTY
jgi:hypothetical protein